MDLSVDLDHVIPEGDDVERRFGRVVPEHARPHFELASKVVGVPADPGVRWGVVVVAEWMSDEQVDLFADDAECDEVAGRDVCGTREAAVGVQTRQPALPAGIAADRVQSTPTVDGDILDPREPGAERCAPFHRAVDVDHGHEPTASTSGGIPSLAEEDQP